MRKIILSLLVLILAGSVAVGATRAYFSDTETSTGNTLSAGTLDLNLDGGNSNVQKFSVVNLKPGDTQTGTWTIHNAGNIAGFLDLHNITQTHAGGTSTGAELAVDPGNVGNLGSLLNAQLFVDANNNGVFDNGDTSIFSGVLSGLGANYEQNLPLAVGGTNYITLVLDWPSSVNDNMGQGDTVQIDLTFELGQTIGQ